MISVTYSEFFSPISDAGKWIQMEYTIQCL